MALDMGGRNLANARDDRDETDDCGAIYQLQDTSDGGV